MTQRSEIRFSARWIFAGLLFLFFFLRLLLLFTHIESISDLEELARGTVAREFSSGILMPFWDYQIDDYSGGSLAVGLLAVPFFLAFGPSLLVLKLIPLLFSLATMLVTTCWVKKKWGNPEALWVMAFFALAPPGFIRLSLLAMGFHSESLLFVALLLAVFYGLSRHTDTPKEGAWILAFGVTAGLGFSFCFITGLCFAGCFVSGFFSRSNFERKARFTRLTAAGFLAGASGFILYNLTHDLRGVKFLILAFLPGHSGSPLVFLPDLLQKAAGLVFRACPASFGWEGLWAPLGVVLTLWVAGRGVKILHRDESLRPLLVSSLFFFLFYAVSDFAADSRSFLDFRYFVFLHYFLLVFCGLGAARGGLLRVAAAGLLLLNMGSSVSLGFKEPWGEGLRFKGYSYYQMGWTWQHLLRDAGKEARLLQTLKRLPEADRRFLEWGLAYGVDFQKIPFKKAALLFSPESRPYLEEALGFNSRSETTAEAEAAQIQNVRLYEIGRASTLYSRDTAWMETGLKSFADRLRNPDTFWFIFGGMVYDRPNLLRFAEGSDPLWFSRGLGREAGTAWVYDRIPLRDVLKQGLSITREEKDFYWGMGWALAREIPEDPRRALSWIRKLPPQAQHSAREGFETCRAWYFLP